MNPALTYAIRSVTVSKSGVNPALTKKNKFGNIEKGWGINWKGRAG